MDLGGQAVNVSGAQGGDNQPPAAVASATPNSGSAPLVAQFTGSNSTDSDGAIVSYSWVFGDGGSSTAPDPQHTYNALGTYSASLTVTDNKGASTTASVEIQVADCITLPAPTAYGNIANGDQTHIDQVTYCFQGAAGNMALSYQVYDVDSNTEVEVILNGTLIFNAPTTGNDQWSSALNATLPDALVNDGVTNVLIFNNVKNPPKIWAWGVRQVSVSGGQVVINQPPVAVISANPASGLAPLAVQFIGSGSFDVDGAVTTYAWEFGDGGTSAQPDPQYTYAASGVFNTRLIVTDNSGVSDTANVLINTSATNLPSVRINCAGLDYTASTGHLFSADKEYVAGSWGYIDDGSDIETTDPIANTSDPALYQIQRKKNTLEYAFDLPSGTYNVILHFAEIKEGKVGERVMDIFIEDNLVIDDLDIFAESGGENIALIHQLDNIILGDEQLYFRFQLAHAGSERAAIAAIEIVPPGGDSIPTNNPPVAITAASPITGAVPLAVQFTGSSSFDSDGTVVSYAWEFGDGTTSNLPDPQHVYNVPGGFTASLTVTDNGGATHTSAISVLVQPGTGNAAPVARASASPSTGAAPLNAQFTGSNSSDIDGTIVSSVWNFGDGGSSTQIDPQHTYNADGSYTAQLIVTDNSGASATATVGIVVGDCSALPDGNAYGKIEGGDQSHIDNVTYCFQGAAGDMTLSYQAYDIDNNTEVEVWLNGTTIFNVPATGDSQWGSTLSATLPDALIDDGGSNILVFDNTKNPPKKWAWGVRQVSVTGGQVGGNQPPRAVASANPAAGSAPLPVQFTGSSSTDIDGTITSFAWEFGDGGVSSQVDPQHIYNTPNNFIARLIVTDNSGGKDTAFVQVTIPTTGNTPPLANASASPPNGVAPLNVQFNGSNSIDNDGTIVNYAWQFGDGGASTQANPQYIYNSTGSFIAQLIVTDNSGNRDTTSVVVAVQSPGGQTLLRINVGGSEYTASNGNVFEADQKYSDGGWGFADSGSVRIEDKEIDNTSDEELYLTQREKVELNYLFDMPNGVYDLILHFAEIKDKEAGQRIMDVEVEEEKVLNDFDVFVEAGGKNTAVTRTITGVALTDGQLNLDLTKSDDQLKRQAAIAAIEIGPSGTLTKQGPLVNSAQLSSIPEAYALEQNYPNPFNPSTNIIFNIPEPGEVQLIIYNAVGQSVRERIVRNFDAGRHTIKLNASQWSTGVYFYEIRINNFVARRKMILAK